MVLTCLNKLQLAQLKARAIGFEKLCKKPASGLVWLFIVGFGWLKPPGQSWYITKLDPFSISR
jgi:hypothetical protein